MASVWSIVDSPDTVASRQEHYHSTMGNVVKWNYKETSLSIKKRSDNDKEFCKFYVKIHLPVGVIYCRNALL